jgi:uncharacterized BrkB/YihY/UPF0761 family membrane protein
MAASDTDAAPSGPTDLAAHSWRGVLTRTVREFREDNLTDWAAALTYYGILSIFPALLALVAVLGLIGPSATQPLIDNLGAVAPGPAKQIVTSAIQNLQKSGGAAGVLFIVGIAMAVWSASGYVAAFMRASNAIYRVPGLDVDLEHRHPAGRRVQRRARARQTDRSGASGRSRAVSAATRHPQAQDRRRRPGMTTSWAIRVASA